MPRGTLTVEEFIIRARKVHGDKYNYDLTTYKNKSTKIRIICPMHGEFWQRPNEHLRGSGCPECGKIKAGKLTTEEFIRRAKKIYGDRYDYSEVVYRGWYNKVKIKCNICGSIFHQTPYVHLRGHGCQKCGLKKRDKYADKIRMTREDFIKRAQKIHKDDSGNPLYDYSKVKYINYRTKVEVICRRHGSFWVSPAHHISSRSGCPKCGQEKSRDSTRLTVDEFIRRAQGIHKDDNGNPLYDYSRVKYINSHTKVEIVCPQHGSFWQTPSAHIDRKNKCPKCIFNFSRGEKEVWEFVESLGFNVEKYKDNKYEIDIFIPTLNLGFEYNGIYYHKFPDKPAKYHQDKSLYFTNKGIKLVHIWEYQWYKKRDIIKSIIRYTLGKIENKVFARNCKIIELSSKSSFNFHQQNHLFGGVYSKINLGLVYNNELVQILSFNPHQSYQWEISRFSTKLNIIVIGGFSKLFRYFIKNYNPKSILTYSYIDLNNIWQDSVYCKTGFDFIRVTAPSYYYVNGSLDVKSRVQCQKYKLTKRFPQYKNLSEYEIMKKLKYFRIYNSGNFKFVWSNSVRK